MFFLVEQTIHKTALITGATAGIGKATAQALAQMGWHVIIHGRSPERCQETIHQIRQILPEAKLDYFIADFTSLHSVRQLVEEVRSSGIHLDVLINNAGAYFTNRKVSNDGFELSLAVNHLAPFLLTNGLLDLLKSSEPARIINVSSGAHKGVSLDFDDLNYEQHYAGFQAYGRSKLMNIYFTYELHRRLQTENPGSRLTVNALHPGFVASNFAKNNGLMFRLVMEILKMLKIGNPKTPQAGAETSIYLASSPSLEGVSGKYFVDCTEVRSSEISYDLEAAERLWSWSENATR